MNPEVTREFDAARDAIALIDAALRGDDDAAQFLVAGHADDGSRLLWQLLHITEKLTRNVASHIGAQPGDVVEMLRRATNDVEGMISDYPSEGDNNE